MISKPHIQILCNLSHDVLWYIGTDSTCSSENLVQKLINEEILYGMELLVKNCNGQQVLFFIDLNK